MDQVNSLSRIQAVRFRDSTIYIQIVRFNGVECIYLEDVQRQFPSVTALCIDNRQLSFLLDEAGQYLNPLRIKARPNHVIEALEPVQKPPDAIHSMFNQIDAKIQATDKKIDLILANTQEALVRLKHVMTQMYELHEYTTPRYFFILPSRHHQWKTINAMHNLFRLHYKLYFLCECSDEPNQLHIAPHDGYSIKAPSEFIASYGSYLRTTISIARGLLSLGGFIVDHTGSVSNLPTMVIPSLVKERANYDEMNDKLEVVESMLNQTNSELVRIDRSTVRNVVLPEAPLQGVQLRELEAYLDLVDHSHSLGNLYRTVTDEGHVRWVCLEHYNTIGFNNKISTYIRQLESIGGKFDQETKQITLTGNLSDKNITMICNALTKGFTMLTLVLQNCSVDTKDLERLFDTIINRSSIHRLIITNIEIHQWMRMSKSMCGYLNVSFKNQSLIIRFSSDCQRVIRFLGQNKICRTFHFFDYDFSNASAKLRRYLKENQELTTLIIHHFMNLEFWNEIIVSNTSLRRLKLTFWFNSSSVLFGLCQAIGQNKTLVELDLMDHTSVDNQAATAELLRILRKHPSIKHLRLHVFDLKPSDKNETSLVDALLNDTFISHLRISDSILSKELIQAIVHASEERHALVHLECYRCQVNEEDTVKLQLLYTKECLTHLTISDQSYWSIALTEMREQIEFPPYQNLKLEQTITQSCNHSSVCLDEMELIDQDMEIIVKESILNKHCNFLSLQSNKFTSIGASILAQSLKENQTLETIYLGNNYISDDGVASLVHVLTSHDNAVKTLVLQKNKITDQGAKHLAHLLESNRTLIWLYLGENDISNEGVRMICKSIETQNQTLEMLVLSSNGLLTDSVVDYLLSMIENNQSLKKLWIDGCNLSNIGKQRLEKIHQVKKDFYIRA